MPGKPEVRPQTLLPAKQTTRFFKAQTCTNAKVASLDTYIILKETSRLIGEHMGYSWSGVRPSSFTMLKDLLLQNRLADQSQIYVEPPLVGERKFVREIWVT